MTSDRQNLIARLRKLSALAHVNPPFTAHAKTIKAAADMLERDDWQPIETAPEDWMRDLPVINLGELTVNAYPLTDGWVVVSHANSGGEPKWWALLPDPPA